MKTLTHLILTFLLPNERPRFVATCFEFQKGVHDPTLSHRLTLESLIWLKKQDSTVILNTISQTLIFGVIFKNTLLKEMKVYENFNPLDLHVFILE